MLAQTRAGVSGKSHYRSTKHTQYKHLINAVFHWQAIGLLLYSMALCQLLRLAVMNENRRIKNIKACAGKKIWNWS
jgi:hypothetical protein